MVTAVDTSVLIDVGGKLVPDQKLMPTIRESQSVTIAGALKRLAVRLCCVLALILSMGCARQLRLHVVDAASGEALTGADVARRKVTSFSYFYRTLRQREVGSTDTNGMIMVPRFSSKDVIYVTAQGYRGAAFGIIEGGSIAIGHYPPPNIDSMHRDRKLLDMEEPILVPMMPLLRKQ